MIVRATNPIGSIPTYMVTNNIYLFPYDAENEIFVGKATVSESDLPEEATSTDREALAALIQTSIDEIEEGHPEYGMTDEQTAQEEANAFFTSHNEP